MRLKIDEALEKKIYTLIGQNVLEMIQTEKWDEAILMCHITPLHSVDIEGESIFAGKSTSLTFKNVGIRIHEVIDELIDYTKTHNYTRWNKMVFRLQSNHAFNIDYTWDQTFHDEMIKSYENLD